MVWESTGQYGQSALRRYELGADPVQPVDTGQPVDNSGGASGAWARLPPEFFGEGICRVGDSIWQLTWRERVALRWDAVTLELREQVRYNREGWGMCAVVGPAPAGNEPASAVVGPGFAGGGPVQAAGAPAGDGPARPAPGGRPSVVEVVTSDGSSELVRRDPDTLEPRAVVQVRCRGERIRGLNDLTWAGGLVWANVAGTNCLAGIDLESAEITDVVDARKAAERHWRDPQAIMNGIAALWQPGEFLLTGKEWRLIRQVRLVPDRDRGHLERLLSGVSR
jgi:glutamine cyclotransferase